MIMIMYHNSYAQYHTSWPWPNNRLGKIDSYSLIHHFVRSIGRVIPGVCRRDLCFYLYCIQIEGVTGWHKDDGNSRAKRSDQLRGSECGAIITLYRPTTFQVQGQSAIPLFQNKCVE